VKIKMTSTLLGTTCGVEPGAGGVCFRRGDVVDLPLADAAHLIGLGHAQPDIDGPLQQPRYRPDASLLDRLAAKVKG
jgi:hypothetical protein